MYRCVYPASFDAIPDRYPGDIILPGLQSLLSDAAMSAESTGGTQSARARTPWDRLQERGKPCDA